MGGGIVSIQEYLHKGKKKEGKKKSSCAKVWHSRQEAKTNGRDTQTATQQGTPKEVQIGREKEDSIQS